jgi:hypothetical protein
MDTHIFHDSLLPKNQWTRKKAADAAVFAKSRRGYGGVAAN